MATIALSMTTATANPIMVDSAGSILTVVYGAIVFVCVALETSILRLIGLIIHQVRFDWWVTLLIIF